MSRLGMPYGEAHTVVLYARATRAAIARPRDCTFFHNYLTFFHNLTTKWTTRRFAFPSRFPCTALISDTVTDVAARTRALARRGRGSSADSVNLKRDTTDTRYKHNPALYLLSITNNRANRLSHLCERDCLQKVKNIGYSS